ncbi:bifunctional nicotinamidase/pyrazinamidase [Flavobacterium sp. I3-2]|uniref:bifunctional nicotinamidase/pyrazinamidase n=1 Tax=Flavobacterium sp. I3-2 TaxID=2748319 RepID=UPI0015A916C0|nr:bifunctional nicotinamidase/pyrazinamidase [Flavobacterium sp. I3-2]
MKALLIIDIQNDFLEGGSLEVKNANAIIPLVNNIQNKFDVVVATQDWHPATHKSFASNHVNKQTFEVIDLNGLPQVLWPNHCVQGSFGAEFHTDLNTQNIHAIFRKGTDIEVDSYSGFYDNDQRKSTGLHGFLTELQVTEVYICGLAADYCVFYTAKDAATLGYKTVVIEDATKYIDKTNYEKAKQEMLTLGIEFVNTGDVL